MPARTAILSCASTVLASCSWALGGHHCGKCGMTTTIETPEDKVAQSHFHRSSFFFPDLFWVLNQGSSPCSGISQNCPRCFFRLPPLPLSFSPLSLHLLPLASPTPRPSRRPSCVCLCHLSSGNGYNIFSFFDSIFFWSQKICFHCHELCSHFYQD